MYLLQKIIGQKLRIRTGDPAPIKTNKGCKIGFMGKKQRGINRPLTWESTCAFWSHPEALIISIFPRKEGEPRLAPTQMFISFWTLEVKILILRGLCEDLQMYPSLPEEEPLWYVISSLRNRRGVWVRGMEKQTQLLSPNPDALEKAKCWKASPREKATPDWDGSSKSNKLQTT